MENKTVKLKTPIKRKGEPDVETLTFREPTGRDLKRLDKYAKAPIEGSLMLAAAVCEQGITPAEFDDMPASDVMQVVDLLGEWIAPDGK